MIRQTHERGYSDVPSLDGTSCRAAAVRRYFGETDVQACGQCDLCLNPPEATDVTVAAQKALSAVHRLGGRFGRGRIVDHLLGKTKDAPASEARLSTFGIGREYSAAGWRDLLDQLQFEGLVREDPNDGRPLIGLGEADGVRAVYRGERRISMRQMMVGGDRPGRKERARKRHGGEDVGVEAADAPLFQALRAWRRERAAEQHVPPYVIFHDSTLSAIARMRPAGLDDLSKVSGVGQSKLKRYGADVLQVVRANSVTHAR
jgi:ATP-dependent DNA helicase RecQ